MNQASPTAGIILAAGRSTRLGRPKQLLPIQGGSLLEKTVRAALASTLDTIILVLGHRHEEMARHLARRIDLSRITTVINRRHEEGLSRSLHTGLNRVKDTHPSVMFLLADQPLINSSAIDDLLVAFRISRKDICVPVRDERRGNPTIFSQKFYDAILRLGGDAGARAIIRSNPTAVYTYPTRNPAYFFDIDTESDLNGFINGRPIDLPAFRKTD